MTHTPFDLNLTNLDTLAVLIHGGYGSGKTHLQGDFLRWGQPHGPVAFVNIRGEDGHASLGAMGLGSVGYTAETIADYEAIMAELRERKTYALAVDSLPAGYELQLIDKYGRIRYPDPKLDGEAAKNHWGQLNLATKNMILLSRQAAPYVLWVSAWDKSEDAVTGGRGVTPNLPGKLAQECAGRFDFVGYMKAEALSASRVSRTVSFAPTGAYLTRQRIARPINQTLTIPDEKGGWEVIFDAMTQAVKGAS